MKSLNLLAAIHLIRLLLSLSAQMAAGLARIIGAKVRPEIGIADVTRFSLSYASLASMPVTILPFRS